MTIQTRVETCSPDSVPQQEALLSASFFPLQIPDPALRPPSPFSSALLRLLLTQFKFIFILLNFFLYPQLGIIAFCCCCIRFKLSNHSRPLFFVFMKLSSSNSTRSAASFDDANIYSDRSGAAAGCIFSVLRRMLFSRSLPTHPSDRKMETCSAAEERVSVYGRMEKRAVDASPGIVARLMGLESMPERITRSRSLNSVDQIKAEEGDDAGKMLQGTKLHRRSKTSVSFRERPTFIELEDDEFIVLRFDDGKKSRDTSSGVRSELGGDELEQLRAKGRRNRGIKSGEQKLSKACGAQAEAPAQSIRSILQPSEPESDCIELKSRREKKQIRSAKKKKKAATESDSEESSPVSIFDFHQSKTGQEAEQGTETPPTSADDDSWTRCSSSSSSSSRQSSPEPEPDKPKISKEQNDQKTEAEHQQQQQHALLSKTVATGNGQKKNREAWDRACNMAVAEIRSAEWGDKDIGDSAAELQVHIMDQLCNELITDLLHSST